MELLASSHCAVQVDPPIKLKVSVDDITDCSEVRNEFEEKLLQTRKEERKESEVIASCGYLEEKFQEVQQKRSGRSCDQRGNTRS